MSKKNDTPHESYEQRYFVAELLQHYPEILIETNPMAGAKLTKQQAIFAKQQGYQAGTLDLFLPEHKVYVEMKRREGGTLTPLQSERIEKLKKAGYQIIIGKGAVDALEQLLKII